MEILRIPAGVYAANCYIIYSKLNREGIVVDPGGDVDEIVQYLNDNKINIKYIVLTHGHGDHIGGVISMKSKLNAEVLVHEDDKDMVEDGSKNLSTTMPMGTIEFTPDKVLKDGDTIDFGGEKALVIHTPGHTKGGICLKIQDNLITGDTLFAGSIGRTDLYGGDYDQIIKSIKEKLMIYPDETKVYSGHGAPSSIGRERVNNPFLR